ncbi:hypothetical protein [Oceanithermus sp.]|uniref:hypothetical protein n=1 Tax=Oceanithermus sp. TaxID=2268145 RepID=UPI00257F0239|nr:hypothetical protein [Oceanithermus sp.]
MILRKGDLFRDSDADVLLVTTNGVLKRNGELVMGAGAARAAARLNPRLPAILGKSIQLRYRPEPTGVYRYGVLYSTRLGLGAFQTKLHFKDPSTVELIRFSAEVLAGEARRHPERTFAVNFPGVGLGGLDREEVLGVLEPLWRDLPIEVWSR